MFNIVMQYVQRTAGERSNGTLGKPTIPIWGLCAFVLRYTSDHTTSDLRQAIISLCVLLARAAYRRIWCAYAVKPY